MKTTPRHVRDILLAVLSVFAVGVLLALPAQARSNQLRFARSPGGSVANYTSLSTHQRAVLYRIAADTWKFYNVDVDPTTHLPMDNIGFNGAPAEGQYTSAANIGVYLWAVVAAHDLGLINRRAARDRLEAVLKEVATLKRFDGFLYQWYNTTNGAVIRNPGDPTNCATEAVTTDNCFFISQVDNGWYASGLIVVRSAFPELGHLVDRLMDPMNFGIFYDNGPEQRNCVVYSNPSSPDNNQPTGQMFGGYYVGTGPAGYHNGSFYSDPRISAYIGMGLHQMPGNVWWRSWRTLPPKACPTDPDFSWQGQWPVAGYWKNVRDPQSGLVFHVWEGHYVYPGTNLTFIPTWAGGMFEGLMANEVVPETSWGTHSFGLADLRWAQVQVKYATDELHLPVWGLSPSSTADNTGNYSTYGVEGLKFPYYGGGASSANPNEGLSQCHGCSTEDVVTPHASFLALDVLPKVAFANIMRLRRLYPSVYGPYGFYDAVNPTTGSVGDRYLVLDQSMIMAAVDNALDNRALQRHFADSSVSWAAHLYLSFEKMSLH